MANESTVRQLLVRSLRLINEPGRGMDPEDDDVELHWMSEDEFADYILEFADHLGIPTYKRDKEEDNNSSDVDDWDSGTTQ